MLNKESQTCVETDECALGTHDCRNSAECRNSPNGFSCYCYDRYYPTIYNPFPKECEYFFCADDNCEEEFAPVGLLRKAQGMLTLWEEVLRVTGGALDVKEKSNWTMIAF